MTGFLNRWSKKKLGVEPELSPSELAEKQSPAQDSKGLKDPALGEQSSEKNLEPVAGAAQAQEVAPTLEDVLKLTKDSDFSAYVKPGIDPEVQKAAMQKLFSDPRYNVMDGLDIYIDDYSKPDPIPLEMLKRMNQSQMLGLFKTPEEKLADEEAERIERADYHQRLKVLEDKEAADEKALADANSKTDVSPSAINAENSAKSPELTDSQESTEIPVVKVEVKTQTKT